MAYAAMDFNYLFGMPGFSDALLKNHMSLYQGYVNHTNKLLETFERLEKEGKGETLEYQEVKRHFGWEFNGMRLHEYYFRNLGGNGDSNQAMDLKRLIEAQWSNFQNWERGFRNTGKIRSVGWAILYQDPLNGQLHNFYVTEHDKGTPAGAIPILVMDVWEHAYMLDYGIERTRYMDAFFRNINWPQVQARVNFEMARVAVRA